MKRRGSVREGDADWLDRAVERWPALAWAIVVGEWAFLGLAVRMWVEGH